MIFSKMRIFLVLSFFMAGISFAVTHTPLDWKEGKEGTERIFTLQNDHLKLVVFPDLGGRIGHIVDLVDSIDLLYWDLGKTSIYHGEGGALDDRRNTFTLYNVVNASEGKLTLQWEAEGLCIEKSISLLPGTSTVRVDYLYRNASQKDLKDYEVMTKNWFLPGGGKISKDDLYCVPTSRGVRTVEGFTAKFGAYPELRGKFMQDVGSWNGVVNRPKERGVITAFSNDYYRWFYVWESGVEVPTYEWVFGELPAGKETAITMWIHVVHGMDRYSFANKAVVTSMKYDQAADRISTALFSAEKTLSDAVVETYIQHLPNGKMIRVEDTKYGRVAVAKTVQATIPWKAEKEGTYLIRQRVLDHGELLAEYEEPIAVGTPSAEYAKAVQFPEKAKIDSVRGWEVMVSQDPVTPEAIDIATGYMIYLDEFASDNTRGKSVSSLSLDMGLEESKSFSFSIRALRDLKNLTVTSLPVTTFKGSIELFDIEKVDVGDKKLGLTSIGEKLVPLTPISLAKGETRVVWVRIRTTRADAGRKEIRFTVSPEGIGTPPLSLLTTITVHPILLPKPNLISLEVEHSSSILPGCWDAQNKRWNIEVLERYTRDLGEHLTDFEQGFWGWHSTPRDNGMLRLATTGQPLSEVVKKISDFSQAPAIDFSYLNPVYDAAIRNGMVRFSGNLLIPSSLPAWVMKEAARYLRDRGYPSEDIWCKYLDEQVFPKFPEMTRDVQWMKKNGFRPYSTFHLILGVPEAMEILSPGFDMYQGGFTTSADLEARIKEKTLKPFDEVWMYQGWGATFIPYSKNRRPGWDIAAMNLDGYHVHVYYRWHQSDAIIFPSTQGPEGSPGWEGMRDGFSDCQYVALARRWIQRLESSRNPSLSAIAKRKLEAIVGSEQSLIPLVRTRQRLVWVERIGTLDIITAEKARREVLSLLTELSPHIKRLGPSLYYGRLVLAEQGKVFLSLDTRSNKAGAAILSESLKKNFNIRARRGNPGRNGVLIDLCVALLPDHWKETNPHITDLYPSAGEYVIHQVPAIGNLPARILIFGRDDAGLRKGIEYWSYFLRTEQPDRIVKWQK